MAEGAPDVDVEADRSSKGAATEEALDAATVGVEDLVVVEVAADAEGLDGGVVEGAVEEAAAGGVGATERANMVRNNRLRKTTTIL